MYPAFPGYAPGDLFDIPDAKRHNWQSKAFFWAPDSQSLMFADRVGDQLSLILVLIKNDKPETYTYRVTAAVCTKPGGAATGLTLKDVTIIPLADATLDVEVSFGALTAAGVTEDTYCQPRRLTLNSRDFRPAKIEVYEHRKLKQSAPIGPGKDRDDKLIQYD